MDMWDVGGQTKIRALWRHYYQGTDALIFVVDASDADRIEEAKTELHGVLRDPLLADTVLLVLANKQDLPNVMPTAELCDKLELEKLRGRQWYVQPCTATTASGLYEGLDWISAQLSKRRR
jgi:ADP-ribosylation factor protein 1